MSEQSQYNSTENLKITYFLGAGASYNSLPIWEKQGYSMFSVAYEILEKLKSTDLRANERTNVLYQNKTLIDFANKLMEYGNLAVEYGSIDIYARRLYLLGDENQLNELKYCLSVYFDLWEKVLYYKNHHSQNEDGTPNAYLRIDKRYLSLLSVILEKNNLNPKLNPSISFVSWNYDLQIEMAYQSFMQNKNSSLKEINEGLRFMESNDGIDERNFDITHLNGFRGIFKAEGKMYPIIENESTNDIIEYLLGLLENYSQFKLSAKPEYKRCIKYAWESDSKSIENAKKIMEETNILIIIGYSFPSFNRKIDSELIEAFEDKGYKKIIYQDPYASQDIVNSLFKNPKDVIVEKENTKQFYIPHEFLFPSPGKEPTFGA